MPTEIQFPYSTGLTLNLKVYTLAGAELEDLACTEFPTTVYSCTSNLAVGVYRVVAFSAGLDVFSDVVTITTAAVSHVREEDSDLLNPEFKIKTNALGQVETSNGGAGGGGSGSGGIITPITINTSSNLPVGNVATWVSTDLAGANVVAGTLYTDTFGNVTFALDAGDYYLWRIGSGTTFSNPVLITPSTTPIVLSDGLLSTGTECITHVDILAHASCCSETVCCSNDVLDAKAKLSVAIIEAITNTKVCPYTECKTFKVDNKRKLFFNPQTSDKLVDIISFTYKDTGADITDYTNLRTHIDLGCDFRYDCGEVEICGNWSSYTTIPENIKEAVILLALEKAQPGSTGLSGSQGAVKSVDWEDFKIEYTDSQISDSVDSTGYFEIDRLISNIPSTNQIKFSIIGDDTKCCKKGSCEC